MFVFADQDIDEQSFVLLNDADLQQLGFTMGHRRLLCRWIGQQSNVQVTQSPPTSSVSSVSITTSVRSSSSSTPAARRPQASQFKVSILMCSIF